MSVEGDNDNVFAFVRSIPNDAPATNQGMSEVEKKLDAAAARIECETVIANWIECKVLQSKLCNKIESNLQQNKTTIDEHDHSWILSMKTLMDHLTEESGERWKFGHVPEMRSNSPCQLGA